MTSVEMGLPIQGYMLRGTKGEREWVDLEEARIEVDRAREKAEIVKLEKGVYQGNRSRKGSGKGRRRGSGGQEIVEEDGLKRQGTDGEESGGETWTARGRLET